MPGVFDLLVSESAGYYVAPPLVFELRRVRSIDLLAVGQAELAGAADVFAEFDAAAKAGHRKRAADRAGKPVKTRRPPRLPSWPASPMRCARWPLVWTRISWLASVALAGVGKAPIRVPMARTSVQRSNRPPPVFCPCVG